MLGISRCDVRRVIVGSVMPLSSFLIEVRPETESDIIPPQFCLDILY